MKKRFLDSLRKFSVFLSFPQGTKIKSLGLNILSLKSFVLLQKIGNSDDLYHDTKKIKYLSKYNIQWKITNILLIYAYEYQKNWFKSDISSIHFAAFQIPDILWSL